MCGLVRHWEDYLADVLSNAPENIDGHWAAIKNALFSGAAQVAGHAPKGRHKIWLTAESWKWIDERKGLKALLTATSDDGHYALEFRYPANSRKVERNVHRDKREFAITLIQEAKDATNPIDFRTAYHITKELACGRESFDSPVKDINGRRFIHDDEQLQRWKEHFTRVLNRITSGKFPPLLDELAASRRKIISAVNVLKPCKSADLGGLPTQLFIAAPAITANPLLPLVWKSKEPKTFPREWKKGMTVKIPKKDTGF